FRKDWKAGSIIRCSQTATNVKANDNCSAPAISSDGHYVAFDSQATNLLGSTTDANAGSSDVFRKDCTSGALKLVSAKATGAGDDGNSQLATISGDGNLVAFESDADDLTTDDTNFSRDVFLKNMTTGTIRRISVSSSGALGDADSYNASINTAGTFIV